jgi:predicted PurR-regulated permease PerM
MLEKQTINISTGIIFRTILIILALWFLYIVRDIIALLFVSVLIVALIEPAVNWMQRKGIRRGIGILLIYLLLLVFLGLTSFFMLPYLSDQFRELVKKIPEYSQNFNHLFSGIENYFQVQSGDASSNAASIWGNIKESFSGISGNIFTTTVGFFSGLISIVVVFALVFYMTVREDGIKNFIVAVVPKKHEEYATSLVIRIKNKIGKWMQGQLIVMLSIFILDFIWLSLLGIPYAFILALFAGIMEIIPFFGPIISAVPGVLLGFLISPWKGLLTIVLYTISQQIESQIVIPQVMRKAVGLNPIVIILSLLIGFKLGGVLGAILAVPIATGINVAFEDMMATRENI